jgi:thiol-disulfide isomerase/thioredoxin
MSKNPLSKKAKLVMHKKSEEKKKKQQKSKTFYILLSSIIAVTIAIIIVVTLPPAGTANSGNLGGKLSPNAKGFTLLDTEGNTHSLDDYTGKPILLDFTASWCTYCHVQAPEVIRLHNDYKNEVTVLSINIGEDTRTAQSNKDSDGCPWPFLVDQSNLVAQDYSVQGIPYLILLKPDGTKYIDQSGNDPNFYNNFSSAIKELR